MDADIDMSNKSPDLSQSNKKNSINWKRAIGNINTDNVSDPPFFLYNVFLKKLDIGTREITIIGQEELCTDDRLSGIMFFDRE